MIHLQLLCNDINFRPNNENFPLKSNLFRHEKIGRYAFWNYFSGCW